MKWFKHDTDGHRSEGLAAIRAQFGFEGVGWWFTILEMVAEKVDETDRCHLELPLSIWCSSLSTKPMRFLRFLDVLSQECRTSHSQIEKSGVCYVSVSIPNLLKKRDEHTSRLGSKSRVTPEQDKEIRVKSKDTESEPPITPPPVPEHVSTAVKIWNEQKAEAWDYVHDPRKIKALITRLTAALKLDGFYLPDIIAKARESDFLNNKRFVTLLWLVSKSTKTGNLNAQDIMAGRYEHQTTKHTPQQPGCLIDDGKNLW